MFSPRLKSGIYLERLEDPVECLPVITCEQQKSVGDGEVTGHFLETYIDTLCYAMKK